jgi:hypothetical protein
VTGRLRDLLDDLATDARDYGDGDRAVATARRRVTARRVAVPAVVAVTMAALVLAIGVVRGSLRLDVGPPGDPSSAPPAVPDYPARIAEPVNPEPLPRAPGGRAAFLWSPACAGPCQAYLVMTDGRQFAVPRTVGPPAYDYTLSPDGTWLGGPAVTGYELRALTDGALISIVDTGEGDLTPWAWSPDGEWFLLARHMAGDVYHFVRVNLTDRSVRRIASPEDGVVAINNDGDLICWVYPGNKARQLPELTIVRSDGSTVDERITVRLPPNATDLIRDGEVVESYWLRLGPDGESGLLVLNRPNGPDDYVPPRTGLLGVDLNLGFVTGRIDLQPVGNGGPAKPWEVKASLAGGVLFTHWPAGWTELVILNTVTGERVVATTLPHGAQVAVRASTWK